MFVAGFTTAHGLPYSVPFQIEAHGMLGSDPAYWLDGFGTIIPMIVENLGTLNKVGFRVQLQCLKP